MSLTAKDNCLIGEEQLRIACDVAQGLQILVRDTHEAIVQTSDHRASDDA